MSLGHGETKKRHDDDKEVVDAPPPPDGGWGWMVVFGSFMIHIIADGVTYSFGIFYDEFLVYFNEGQGKTSLILSMLVGVTLLSGPISSSLVNRWGCRPVTIAGSILASICMVVSVWAKNVITLCITIGLGTGIGFGLIYLPAIVSVTTYFEKKRSLATGIAVCGSGLGTFLFAPIITLLLNEFGWRGTLLIIAGLVLNCIIFGAFFRPLETEPQEVVSKTTICLKNCDGQVDLHVSEHNLHEIGGSLSINDESQNIHRPRSMGHFSMPRSMKIEQNGNVPNDKYKVNDISRLALSQPMLPISSYGSQSFRKPGPIDRPDVFYQGSLMNIPSYRSRADLKKGEEAEFVERRHSSYSYRKRHEGYHEDEQSTICGVIKCSQETKDTLNEMLDFSLFKDPVFILFTLSNFLTSIGFNIPYVYIVPKAKSMGITGEDAGYLISVIGGANTVGRIVLGYIADKPWVNRLAIYNWCLTICGIATGLSAFCTTFYSLAVYCSVFGFTIGAYVGLTSVILVDLLGLDKLTNAFGLLLLFQGIASLVGPPLAGALFDYSNSYDPAFYLAGVNVALSGIILFFIPVIQRYRLRQAQGERIADL